MNRRISKAVLLAGLAFIAYGLATGAYTSEKTIAVLCGGAVYLAVGCYGLSRPSKYTAY